MTRVALRCLWKEAREQRATLLVLAALVALALVGTGLALPEDPFRDGLVLAIATAACALAALLTVGGDLVAGEDAQALRFLERLPAGLTGAFLGKLALFLVAVPGTALFGFAIAAGVSWLRSGAPPPLPDGRFATIAIAPCALLALWTFAASTWVPRGALALPAAAAALALLAWPAGLALGGSPWFAPTDREWIAFLALGAVGALAAARWSFCAGRRFGRGASHALWRGLAVGALCFAPSWGWAGARWHASRTIDPQGDDFRVEAAWLGAGGRYAFLNCWRTRGDRRGGVDLGSLPHVLAVELETASWRVLGEPGSRLSEAPDPLWPRPLDSPGAALPVERLVLFASSDGELLGRVDGRSAALSDARRFELEREASGWREPPDGSVWGRWAGLGCQVLAERGVGFRRPVVGYHDPSRDRSFPLRELFGERELEPWQEVLVRPGAWLVVDPIARETWSLDPDEGALRAIDELAGAASVGPLLEDGRALVVRQGELALFDPERGRFDALAFADGREEWVRAARNARQVLAPLGAHRPIVLRIEGLGWSGFARLDLDDLSLHPTAACEEDTRLVACADEASLLVLEDSRRLVRLRFDAFEREIVFPPARRSP